MLGVTSKRKHIFIKAQHFRVKLEVTFYLLRVEKIEDEYFDYLQ